MFCSPVFQLPIFILLGTFLCSSPVFTYIVSCLVIITMRYALEDRPSVPLAAGADTANAVYKRFAERSAFGVPTTRVGISAHIGGMIVGCITGIVFLRDVREQLWERILGWCCLVLYIGLVAACILINVFGEQVFGIPDYYPPDDKSACFWNNFTCPFCRT